MTDFGAADGGTHYIARIKKAIADTDTTGLQVHCGEWAPASKCMSVNVNANQVSVQGINAELTPKSFSSHVHSGGWCCAEEFM